jgi:hypothetical protein
LAGSHLTSQALPVDDFFPMKFIFLHHHIFKNAGSSLDYALKREFGEDGFVEFHPEQADDGRVSSQQLLRMLADRPAVRAVSSHHFFGRDFEAELQPDDKEKIYFFDAVVLRHPLTRLASIYTYYRGFHSEHPLQLAAHRLEFPDFLEYLLYGYPNFCLNTQTTMFGSWHYGVPPDGFNLTTAQDRLRRCALLGIVEEYARTMCVAEYFLAPVFPELRLHGKSENISRKDSISGYDGSLESLKLSMGASFFDEFLRLNQWDVALWEWAQKELHRRSDAIWKFDSRLEEFKSR